MISAMQFPNPGSVIPMLKSKSSQRPTHRPQKSETTAQVIPTAPFSLDKRGILPLYLQIEQSLMEKIKKGILSEGEPLQSEQELARYYNVSRMTARQALHGLKHN